MLIQEKQAFQLKGGMLPYTKLQLNTANIDKLRDHLTVTTQTAPKLFQQMPVILDLTHITPMPQLQLKSILTLLTDYGLVPFAIEGEVAHNPTQSKPPLPLLNQIKNTASLVNAKKNNDKKNQTLLIEQNIRSGQQIAAENGDLVVWGSVSAGAEIMAIGHIHVYGRLYGKAMAGMKGDKESRIIANNFAPELVAIAGIYALSEQIPEPIMQNKTTQVHLEQDQLRFKAL